MNIITIQPFVFTATQTSSVIISFHVEFVLSGNYNHTLRGYMEFLNATLLLGDDECL